MFNIQIELIGAKVKQDTAIIDEEFIHLMSYICFLSPF